MSDIQRPWLQSYPKGVRADIPHPIPYKNLSDFLYQKFQEFAPKPAFENLDHILTYEQTWELSCAFANFLRCELGLQPGDRIAIQLPNILAYPVALFGALLSGLTVVNTNPLYTADEMLLQFQDSQPKAIVILSHFADKLEKILAKTSIESVIIAQVPDLLPEPKRSLILAYLKWFKKAIGAFHIPQAISFEDAIALGKNHKFEPINVDLNHVAFLQYTGGTTGISKGAALTHSNILSNVLQITEWMQPLLSYGQEVALTPLPMYHIFSLTVNTFGMIGYGSHNILITNPRDLDQMMKILEKKHFTVMTGVNTLFNGILHHPRLKRINWKNLKVSVAGAMSLQSPVAKKWMEETQSLLVEGYGLTEASPVVCCNPITREGNRLGTVGLPLPSTWVTIQDDDGRILGPEQPGEICVQGPQVMKEYWGKPEETQKVLVSGWLRTGDIGIMDEKGYLRIVDRKKDMIIVSGFNVYPNEVEEVLASHPAVFEAAVVGVPDEKSGEAVKAFVVKKGSVSEKELIDYCRQRLTAYKVPKFIEFRKELPKSNVGKVLRRQLRQNS